MGSELFRSSEAWNEHVKFYQRKATETLEPIRPPSLFDTPPVFDGGSEAGVSARIRDLRKSRFGQHTIERRRIEGGLWAYRLLPKPEGQHTLG